MASVLFVEDDPYAIGATSPSWTELAQRTESGMPCFDPAAMLLLRQRQQGQGRRPWATRIAAGGADFQLLKAGVVPDTAILAASGPKPPPEVLVTRASRDGGGRKCDPAPVTPRVLVVDDDATTGTTLARLLTYAGFEASSVQSGIEGLQRALSDQCDALVLDLQLPDMPGLTVLSRLRASGSDLPVIPITGHYLGEEHRRHAEALRISDFLYKPVFDQALTEALRKAICHLPRPADDARTGSVQGAEDLPLLLRDVERRVQSAFPRMAQDAAIDAVQDALLEFIAHDRFQSVPPSARRTWLLRAAWRNMANAWRSERRRLVRENAYVRELEKRMALDENASSHLAALRSRLLACAKDDAERRAVVAWLDDGSCDMIAAALGCAELATRERRVAVARFKERLTKRARREVWRRLKNLLG
jgi:CheY-like chemotaxis protein/DNA-directed RNA polymerase specialized sigma24 family protein